MSQPVEFTSYQEYMMAANAQYKKNGQQPQLYQAIGPVTNMVPGIFPIPLISMRPTPDFDYSRWVAAEGYPSEQGFVARPMEPTNGTPLQLANPGKQQSNSRPSSPPLDLNSPRFGPGPPIVTSERVKGPRGCNLFVFHLPNEITNWDLYLLFRRFGTILSVHTMVNKSTGLSKGFGFVSYSAPQEATAAITEMDGFRLGKKRLKVQLKRSQDDNPDDDLELDENGSAFYPANGHYDANGPNSKDAINSRQSFNSAYSYENGGSGNTTRASTPYGHHKPNDDNGGYYHGVDSTCHTPTALDKEDEKVEAAMKNMRVGSHHNGGSGSGSNKSDSSGGR